MTVLPTWDMVTAHTAAFRGEGMPVLRLNDQAHWKYSVYILECAGNCYYVGVESRDKLATRLKAHWEGRGADYTRRRKPTSLVLLQSAPNTAVEAYAFYALLATMPAGSVARSGGWVQTGVEPSPLQHLQFEQARRQLTGRCFNCGHSGHKAAKCPKPLQGFPYVCLQCGRAWTLSSRGETVSRVVVAPTPQTTDVKEHAGPRAQSKFVPVPVAARPSRSARRGHKRTMEQVATEGPHAACIVRVMNKEYTGLSWFLAQRNPSPANVRKAKEACWHNSLELQGGDLRTLALNGYVVRPPQRGKELLPGRERLGSQWTSTPIMTDRGIRLQVRRPYFELQKQVRQILWLRSDLEKVLASAKRQRTEW